MAKSYKNVYTILEKVKKGEIDSYYKDREGLFGKLNYYKKPDLVAPHLHYIDERRLDSILDAHMFDGNVQRYCFETFKRSTDFRKIEPNKIPDQSGYMSRFKENYKKFPKHISKDVFKMYYNKIANLEFEDRNEKNNTKFKFLEKANNPVGKIMSERSNLKSAIYTRNTLAYFISRMTMLEYVDPEASKEMQKAMEGDGDGDSGKIERGMKNMMENSDSKKMLEQAMKEAQELCKDMDDLVDEEIQEKMFKDADEGRNGAAKVSTEYLKQVASRLENIHFSMGSLKEKIKKLMDKSASYFSAKKKTIREDLFNSDNIAGLDEYELLHPKLRKIFIEDVTIKDTKSVGKIDVYVDISGSMSSSCGTSNKQGNYISKLDFCKSFVAKLKDLDMLNDLYSFENSVKKVKNDIISIAMMDCTGGTDINKVVKKIIENKRDAIVITDAEDNCEHYSEKAFFIGVAGSRFSQFQHSVIRQYSENNQVIVFDGTTIKPVNTSGHVAN